MVRSEGGECGWRVRMVRVVRSGGGEDEDGGSGDSEE